MNPAGVEDQIAGKRGHVPRDGAEMTVRSGGRYSVRVADVGNQDSNRSARVNGRTHRDSTDDRVMTPVTVMTVF